MSFTAISVRTEKLAAVQTRFFGNFVIFDTKLDIVTLFREMHSRSYQEYNVLGIFIHDDMVKNSTGSAFLFVKTVSGRLQRRAKLIEEHKMSLVAQDYHDLFPKAVELIILSRQIFLLATRIVLVSEISHYGTLALFGGMG